MSHRPEKHVKRFKMLKDDLIAFVVSGPAEERVK